MVGGRGREEGEKKRRRRVMYDGQRKGKNVCRGVKKKKNTARGMRREKDAGFSREKPGPEILPTVMSFSGGSKC